MRWAVVLCVGFAVAGCGSHHGPRPDFEGCSDRVLDRIYFGFNTPDGQVSDEQWRLFLEKEVTPRFPAGLTVVEARGQWRNNAHAVEREQSRIVEILHENNAEAGARIDKLVSEYKSRFQQEAVLVIQDQVRACFH